MEGYEDYEEGDGREEVVLHCYRRTRGRKKKTRRKRRGDKERWNVKVMEEEEVIQEEEEGRGDVVA